jgi:hypothetical protein
MPWIVDGNNVAGGRGRADVRRAVLALARAERVRLLVFFDGAPPPGSPAVERLGSVEIRYVPDADRAIIEHLGSRGRGWRLATDDHALASAARHAGAEVVSAGFLWARVAAAGEAAGESDPAPAAGGKGYRAGVEPLPVGAVRVPRRRKPGHGWS